MTRPVMPCVGGLKLLARDGDDLAIISAHLQDAVCKVGDIIYQKKERRLLAEMNRFCWFSGQTEGPFKRYRTVLHFEGVLNARARDIVQDRRDAVLELLSLVFEPESNEPEAGGLVTLVFAGGGELALEVECVEAALTDIFGPYLAEGKPEHTASDPADAA